MLNTLQCYFHDKDLSKILNSVWLYTVELLPHLILSMPFVTMFSAKSLPR